MKSNGINSRESEIRRDKEPMPQTGHISYQIDVLLCSIAVYL